MLNLHIFCKHVQRRTFIMANNDISYIDWQFSNLAETFKLFKQRLELYFIVNKIEIEQQVNYILFIKQLEPKENFRINRLKLITFEEES